MRLGDLSHIGSVAPEHANTGIDRLALDSRKVGRGTLFAALPGSQVDGSTFIPAAVSAGASAILCEPGAVDRVPDGVSTLVCEDARRGLALAAGAFYRERPEIAVGITGTNGKTSVASFTSQIWNEAGVPSATIGTLGITHPDGRTTPSLTTPDTITLHENLVDLAREGVRAVALEASSHGLDQHRLDGLPLRAAAFTNITRDHLDYHLTFAAYLTAKMRIFSLLDTDGVAVVDAGGEGMADVERQVRQSGVRVVTVGRQGCDVTLSNVEAVGFTQRLSGNAFGRPFEIDLPLAGDFQASNALVALALAVSTGVDTKRAVEALATLRGAPGRLEHVATTPSGGRVFIDYAHTPASLSIAIDALRPFAKGRLIVLAGAGGDRDAGKRPLMGAAIAAADVSIVSDDNPRSEDPASIRASILEGCPGAVEIGDRRAAIAEGVGQLDDGDVFLVAGKGHETGQTIAGVTHPFSDHDVVREAVRHLEQANR